MAKFQTSGLFIKLSSVATLCAITFMLVGCDITINNSPQVCAGGSVTCTKNNGGNTPTQSPVVTQAPPTQSFVPTTALTSQQPELIGTPTGTYEGCPYSEVHHAPDGTTWTIDVGNQPTSLQIWSNRTSNQTLYKVWLPNGFHTSDGKPLVFPGGGGEYDTFALGCNAAAQDWYNRDGTHNTATVDQLLNSYNLAVEQ